MRVFLALAALFLCVYEGGRRRRLLRERVEFLGEIQNMLCNFSSEIALAAPTLEELLSRENGKFARDVIEKNRETADIKASWDAACEAIPQKYAEAAVLFEFGRNLVSSGTDGAQEIIAVYSAKIARLEAAARDDYTRRGAAVGKIWALCGVAAAIVII